MAFYNDKYVLAHIDLENILLFRKFKSSIILNRIEKESDKPRQESIVEDILEEYDIGIGMDEKLYIVYQNKEMHIVMIILDKEKVEKIQVTSEPISEVIDLNIIIDDSIIHIIYISKIKDNNDYRINHYHYKNDWNTYIIEDIKANKVLNPIKLIKKEQNIFITYYNDENIYFKKFNSKKLSWCEPILLVESPEEKLYLDMIKTKKKIHLTYSMFKEGNLIIKYERFKHKDGLWEKESEEIISNKGSLSHPTIIIFQNYIWVTWIELDKVMCRVSKDWNNWSKNIYMWDRTKKIDFVRYKYIRKHLPEDMSLDYSFGSISPQIEFIGFGSLDDTIEVPIQIR